MKFPGETFWPMAERFTYYVLFPAMLIHKLAVAPLDAALLGSIPLLAAIPLLTVTAALWLAFPALNLSGPRFTSLYQGAIRFNTYIGLAAADALYGSVGLATAALLIALKIPLVNLLCVTIFARHGDHPSGATPPLLREVARNPLILGCVVGAFLNLTGIGLPGWLEPTAKLLGAPALTIGLLAVGVGLKWDALRASGWTLWLSSGVKLLIMPLLALLLAHWLGLPLMAQVIVVLFHALPTATSAYILSRQLGGDAPLMAGLITAQTLLAMLTLPLWIVLTQNG
ncbi:putative auxin efflux carrier [Magnetofaba australis IT-1]|uniref:Putative auxin efflux carrier n=2 Tax=Magnetofaba TaxID=1472292 RepID=A0A1Y2K1D6_9PROT|nr:putative auxin efflux carrier [Magnetofaba australis IT-1]